MRDKLLALLRGIPAFRGKTSIGDRIIKATTDFTKRDDYMVLCQMQNGYSVWLDLRSKMQRWVYATGEYDYEEILSLSKIIQKSHVILDIGANIGLVSLQLAHTSPSEAKVYAIEPMLSNYEMLNRTLGENNLQTKVLAHQLAFGDADQPIVVVIADEENMGNKSEGLTGNAMVQKASETDTNTVPMVLLDVFLESHNIQNKVDFIKVDVEGWETPYSTRCHKNANRIATRYLF